MNWTPGDISGSQTLTEEDHLYAAHVTELREAIDDVALITLGLVAVFNVLVDPAVTNYGPLINTAIVSCNLAGGGIVQLPEANLPSADRIVPMSKVKVRGYGKGVTTITSSNAFDYAFYNTAPITNFVLQDLTINVNNTNHGSGWRLNAATACTVARVETKNGPDGGWLGHLGAYHSATDGIVNVDNKIIDCDFDTHAGSLEMLLIYNASNTEVKRLKFLNKTDSGPAFGLWQKCYGTHIDRTVFRNLVGSCFYYSVTTENTWINDIYAENTGSVISGSQTSDNGNFGLHQAQNLHIGAIQIKGGANSANSTGIQLGSVNNWSVTNPIIENMQIGMRIDAGNNSNTYGATNGIVSGHKIRNNNATNNNFTIHPGILFSGVGGSLYINIVNGSIYDDLNGYQAYPISFDGAYVWDNINILNNRLSKSGGGTSIVLADGASLGSNVVISGNMDYTGTNPTQSGYALLGSAQTFTAANKFTQDTPIGAGATGGTGAYAQIGVLGTNNVWVDARGSFTDIDLNLRAKGVGIIGFNSKVNVSASTTTRAGMNVASGVAPTTPSDGDIWFDGTNLKIRIAGVTKTFTVT